MKFTFFMITILLGSVFAKASTDLFNCSMLAKEEVDKVAKMDAGDLNFVKIISTEIESIDKKTETSVYNIYVLRGDDSRRFRVNYKVTSQGKNSLCQLQSIELKNVE